MTDSSPLSTHTHHGAAKGGFVSTILLVLVALIAAKYFLHFDIVQYLETPGPQKVIQAGWTWIKDIYAWIDTQVAHLAHKS